MASLPASFRLYILFVLFASGCADAFSWGTERRARGVRPSNDQVNILNAVHMPPSHSRLPNVYATALEELQELESEPLCHRIAARLLVNNCQLLDGQDEATVHTDSGRAARDFVDSYAASLAICDLERGSFIIPSSCTKFRESTLATLPSPLEPHLHVTTPEIDGCLEGLAQSDSAWNTWVSYRHKALRFCEAARADNEKDKNIHMYQRLTKILEKLTTQVEVDLEARLRSLDTIVQETVRGVGSLGPQVDHLRSGLGNLESVISGKLFRSAEESTRRIKEGLDDAANLQQLLTILVQTVLDNNAKLAESHTTSLQTASQQVGNEVGIIMTALATAVVSSSSLNEELDMSHSRVSELSQKQDDIESSMVRLEGFAHNLSLEHAHHQGSLKQAQSIAGQLMDTLESASSTATTLGTSMSSKLGFGEWVPYIFCPVVSLVMGSYGLPPSTGRNILLIGLGEIAGFAIFNTQQYMGVLFPSFEPSSTDAEPVNSTSETGVPTHFSSDFIKHEDLRRINVIKH